LAFSIQAAFYQTGTFYLLSVSAVVLAGWGAWRLRVRALRRKFDVVLEERTRIARDIHDTVLQSMAGVALELEGLAIDNPSATTVEGLRGMRRLIERSIADARQSIMDLRSPVLERHSLSEAIEEFAQEYNLVGERKLSVESKGNVRRLPRTVEESLLRIAQEAIRNAVRHAHAQHVSVTFAYDKDTLLVRISDDGCGFDVRDGATGAAGQWGLKGMHERANRIGGRIRIASARGRGTEVEVWVPIQ
jgi:signal transduction histidine kinase